MRTRIVALLTAAALAGGYVGVAQAEKPAEPGRDHGICTAYFNGQKNGHDKQDEAPGPFGDLEAGHEDLQAIYDFCNSVGIGGNPDENGRFTDCFDDSDADPSTDSCTDGQQ